MQTWKRQKEINNQTRSNSTNFCSEPLVIIVTYNLKGSLMHFLNLPNINTSHV